MFTDNMKVQLFVRRYPDQFVYDCDLDKDQRAFYE